MKVADADLPADLAAAKERIDNWRNNGAGRRHLPDEFWLMAADLVASHGVYRVSRALRLRYDKLKDRAATRKATKRASTPSPKSDFIQVAGMPLVMPDQSGQSMIELSDVRGHKMLIRCSQGVDAAALVKAFCGESVCSK